MSSNSPATMCSRLIRHEVATTGSSEHIEEERRLLNVAMTRARQHLQLMAPCIRNALAIARVRIPLSRVVSRQVAELFKRGAQPPSTRTPHRPA